MLSFQCCNLLELVDEICCLTLLRHLDLSSTMITNLPDSICRLYNLQTLLLENCFKLIELPSDFCKLVKLRHLNLKDTYINKMPNQIGKLKHLRTLTDFVVGENGGSHIKELAKCNHLQGALHISGLENVTHPAFAREANFKGKEHLAELVMRYGLDYGNGRESDGSIIERNVLKALQPNNNLNRLIIQGYCGNSFPNWLGECHLPNLVSLELQGCEFCSRLPPLGQLPSLKELSISSCDRIEIIDEEFYDNSSSNVPFRSLEILGFNDMPNWNKWLCARGFPSLKELFITNCPKLIRAMPQHLPSLKILVIFGCQELEASISANIKELELSECENILMNEMPSSLKRVFLGGTRVSHTLRLENCSKLRVINYKGLLHLKSLTLLGIEYCPCLERLPEKGLPNSISTLFIA